MKIKRSKQKDIAKKKVKKYFKKVKKLLGRYFQSKEIFTFKVGK